jgi:hypothetical protein
MSDSEPDQILAEESDNPWVKLILWTQESPLQSIRWNGFMKCLFEENWKFLQSANLTEEQRLGVMKWWGVDSAELKHVPPLSDADLEIAKSLFPADTDFGSMWPDITIDNHRFREALNFRGAIFLNTIRFTKCCFERGVDFFGANFKLGASFPGSKFLDEVNFMLAQFRADVTFDSVTFCGPVRFYCHRPDGYFTADFNHALFKTMTPFFHGRNFHPACHFHAVTWPEIPKRNGPKRPVASIDDTLLRHITSYEYIRTQAEKIGQLELRKEMIRRELACRAEAAEPSFERFLRKAYGWICNHGTSIGRPALGLFGLWVFNFVAWQGWAAQEAALTTWDVIYHSGGRMLPLVSGHAYVEPETLNAIRAAPQVLHFFSACAAILSPFLLFLMALALRLKFRMSV